MKEAVELISPGPTRTDLAPELAANGVQESRDGHFSNSSFEQHAAATGSRKEFQ